MKRTTIHCAVLSAIVALYSAPTLATSLIDGTHSFDSDTTIEATDVVESSNRWGGIGATTGDMVVNIADGATLSVGGNRTGEDRLYGAVAQTGSSLTINGNTLFDLSNTSADTRGIRANGGDITLNGDTTVVAKVTTGQAIGAEAWTGATLQFNGKTTITAQSEGGRVIAVQNFNSPSSSGLTVIDFNGPETVINAINTADSTNWTQGVLAYQSTTNFAGNTTINVKGGTKTTYGVDVQCDPGNPFDTIVNFNGERTEINVSGTGQVEAIRPSGVPGQINFNGSSVIVNAESTQGEAHGFKAQYGAHLNVAGDASINVSGSQAAYGVTLNEYAEHAGNVAIDGNLTATVYSAQGDAYGILNAASSDSAVSEADGVLTIGGVTNLNVTAENGTATGIKLVGDYAKANLQSLNITVTGNGASALTRSVGAVATGIVAEGSTITVENGVNVVANGANTVGIQNIGGEIILNGASNISAEQALTADAGSTLTVGSEGTSSQLVVNGIVTNEGQTNLTNATYAVNGSGSTLGSINTQSASTVSFGEGQYEVASLASDGSTTVLLNDLSDATQITITEKTGEITRAASGSANDAFGNAKEAAVALQEKLSVANDTSEEGTSDTVLIQEGNVNNGLTAKVDANGNLSDVAETKNTKLDALGSVSALSAMTLRHEMNSLSKRMGELRDAPAGVGTWARYYGSEMEYGAQNLTSKNNTIQVGSDYTVGDWKVGVAANYTDGESSYDNGRADNKNYGFAVYGTWFVPCGAYVDLIAKYSRMDNDFALNGMNGSYENNAFNVSAETGYRFEFMDGGLFVEPQVGVSYGRIMGDDFTAQNGVRVEQDDYDSLIGRVGVRTGFKFPKDKGLIYARVSGLYDFQGEMNATATSGSARNTIEEDLGGAWLELGVGANFNWTNNTYSYIDIERTNGGDVKENYRFNVGIRHTF